MEGTPTPVVSGRASKIPPIYERPTTSNISVEKGGVLNESKSCSVQEQQSSVTRGVRSRLPVDVTLTKVETIPLLSPTMECEFLKEPWTFPRTKTNSAKAEDTAVLSAWEEDFQDLSDWCMDTFQGQCNFHIGESTRFKLSGTKYEGNGVSTVEEKGLSKNLRSTIDDEKEDLKIMNTTKTTDKSSDNHRLLLSPLEMVKEYAIGCTNKENNVSSSWLMSPESTASTSTSSSKQHNADVSAPIQSECRESVGDLDYASPTSFDSTANQREMWDELRTIETTGSETFDLLSYLWEDEMRSPEGSVSADSSAVLKLRSLSTSTKKVKTEEMDEGMIEERNEPTPPTRRRMGTRATSTVTSSSEALVTTSSRRSERTKASAAASIKERDMPVVRAKTRDKNGRKRYYESDSEDDDISLSQYRECREKNNEASRRSRMNKKAKESEMIIRALDLERDNKVLKMKVEELEKLVTSMRTALLRCALKKEI